jgi:para-aminobenzoate synthetase component 1
MEDIPSDSQVYGHLMTVNQFQKQLNSWGHDRVPFLFIIDFEMEKPRAWALDEINPDDILFNFNNKGNGVLTEPPVSSPLKINAIPFQDFKSKFDIVMKHLSRGDSFLTNLTLKFGIQGNLLLQELFFRARAPYKMWLRNQFLFFSPETFVQIFDGAIATFPMKGTMDAAIPNAHETILTNPKELAEHTTIVDLLRNDLSQVSARVEVKRFRYIDEIKTQDKTILQVSSEISGKLAANYLSHLGDIVVPLLPAGSISGAPKRKSVEIIHAAEKESRGYYTGVAGYFDGERLDSCVMIRFIEQQDSQFYYRSGAGLTTQSQAEEEYLEILNKIYVPID